MVGIRRCAVLALALVALVLPNHAAAQARGGVEIFFGINYLPLALDGAKAATGDSTLNLLGIHGDITYYPNDTLGIVLDGSFPRQDIDVTVTTIAGDVAATVDFSQATYLVGPRFRFNAGGAFAPSIQGLVGFSSGSASTVRVEGIEVPILVDLDDSSFAAALTANFDLRVGSTFAVRLLQAGVIFTGYGDQSQTSLRLSAGIVGRF